MRHRHHWRGHHRRADRGRTGRDRAADRNTRFARCRARQHIGHHGAVAVRDRHAPDGAGRAARCGRGRARLPGLRRQLRLPGAPLSGAAEGVQLPAGREPVPGARGRRGADLARRAGGAPRGGISLRLAGGGRAGAALWLPASGRDPLGARCADRSGALHAGVGGGPRAPWRAPVRAQPRVRNHRERMRACAWPPKAAPWSTRRTW